ncbi:MAG TPA: right-handed parallel beta-helix repeat-containing protein [Solirubrobacterales bacterium]|nr:right-handed parallel beta-helix repeat-containing protein [Solirubrobacterales bacterium]
MAVLFALVLPAPAGAGTISVTTTFDQLDGSVPCSLREAVNTANADANSGGCTDANPAAADTIRLAAHDYNLQRRGAEHANAAGDLDVTESLAIAGEGAEVTGINGNGSTTNDRVVQVSSGTLTISGLTIHDGAAGAAGGGIQAAPGTTLTLMDSTVSGNDAGYGGGIYAATVKLTDSTVGDNTAVGGTGGIQAGAATLIRSTVSANRGDGISAATARFTDSTVSANIGGGIAANVASLINSTVSDNTGAAYGGGILVRRAATLTDSTVKDNESGLQGGGGIYVESGSLTVARSTVSNNSSSGYGGGIFFRGLGGTLNITNSTLTGNESGRSGGALSTEEGTTNLKNATITRNIADADAFSDDGSGGGLDARSSATVNLKNTILAGNLDRRAPDFPDWNCSSLAQNGRVVSQGYNLYSSTAGCTVAPATGDQTAADPGLALLANNGGATLTHALLSGSPAINTGTPAAPGSGSGACRVTDQRGVPRSLGGRCDKGAYERVSCQGKLVNRVGTGGADRLVGSQAGDGILALGGNDVLLGRSSGDGLCGGDGNDQLFGGSGPDLLDGGGGTDACDGGTESDQAVRCETKVSIP